MKWVIIIFIYDPLFAFMIHVNSFRTDYCVFTVGWFTSVQHMWRPRNQVSCCCCNEQYIDNSRHFPFTSCQRAHPWCLRSCQITPILTAAFTTALPPPHRDFISSALGENSQFLMFQEKLCSLEMAAGSTCKCSFMLLHRIWVNATKFTAKNTKTATNF